MPTIETSERNDTYYRSQLESRGCLYLDTGNQFIGNSGKHLTGYCNVDPALTDVRFMHEVGYDLAQPYVDLEVDTVLVPAIGAIPLGQWTAFHLSEATGRPVATAWADKVRSDDPSDNGVAFALTRNGFRDQVAGKRVVAVEDMINQMHSVNKLLRMALADEAEIVGVGALAANAGVSAESLHVPQFQTLCRVIYDAYPLEACLDHGPCSELWPVAEDDSLGHAEIFQETHPDYPGGFVKILSE
ncbi:MAG TPA: hypothetical protein VLF87_01730 [Patescibacteria group bacterium]|nr:hypothetical protein [Patescibacteria group bacterium]